MLKELEEDSLILVTTKSSADDLSLGDHPRGRHAHETPLKPTVAPEVESADQIFKEFANFVEEQIPHDHDLGSDSEGSGFGGFDLEMIPTTVKSSPTSTTIVTESSTIPTTTSSFDFENTLDPGHPTQQVWRRRRKHKKHRRRKNRLRRRRKNRRRHKSRNRKLEIDDRRRTRRSIDDSFWTPEPDTMIGEDSLAIEKLVGNSSSPTNVASHEVTNTTLNLGFEEITQVS